MNIIYRINQSDSATSLANAKRVTRTLNLDTDNDGIRIVPEGESDTDGLFIPSTASQDFGKVFVGRLPGGQRIYKELADVVVDGQGAVVEPVALSGGGTGIKISTNIVGTDGIQVTQIGDQTRISFAETNTDGVCGFSMTRYGGNPFNYDNPSLVGDKNPDWVKNMDSSLVSIQENTLSKTYDFVAPKTGIWSISYAFNDVWESTQPIDVLTVYAPEDFGRQFTTKVEIIKKDPAALGASMTYQMKYTGSVNKFQPLTNGMTSSFILSRSSTTVASTSYVYLLFLDSNYNIVGKGSEPAVVSFAIGESEKLVDTSIVKSVDASYVMWSFSPTQKLTKTVAPFGNVGTIVLAHQTVRTMSGLVNVENTFDRSFWLLLEEGDTVRATCTFTERANVPMCEVAFSSIYMLPSVQIGGTSGGGQTIYDAVVSTTEQFSAAMADALVYSVYIKLPIDYPTVPVTYNGSKNIYGERVRITSGVTIGNDDATVKPIKFYNEVLMENTTQYQVLANHVWFTRISRIGSVGIDIDGARESYYEFLGDYTSHTSNLVRRYWSDTSGAEMVNTYGDQSTITGNKKFTTGVSSRKYILSSIADSVDFEFAAPVSAGYVTNVERGYHIQIDSNTPTLIIVLDSPHNEQLLFVVDDENPPEIGTQFVVVCNPCTHSTSGTRFVVFPSGDAEGAGTSYGEQILTRCNAVMLIYRGKTQTIHTFSPV